MKPSKLRPTTRPAQLGDLDTMVGLLNHLFAQETEFTPEPRLQRRALRRILGHPSIGCLLVVEAQGEVVGMVSLLASVSTALGSPVAWLEDLVVAPEWRGLGLGKILMKAALAEAKRRGWKRVSLLTDAGNARAQAFYKKHGFSASPMRPYRRLIG